MQYKNLRLRALTMTLVFWAANVNFAHSQELPAASVFPQPSEIRTPELVQGLPDFSPLVNEVGPSVVNIRTMARVRNGVQVQGHMSPEMREFFEFFFDSPIPRNDSRVPGRQSRGMMITV